MENEENSYALLFDKYYGQEFSSGIERKTYEDEAQAEMFFLAHSERLSKNVHGDKKSNLLFFINAANAVACKIDALVTFELYEKENMFIATIAFDNDHLTVIENDALTHFTTMSDTADAIEIGASEKTIFITGTFYLK